MCFVLFAGRDQPFAEVAWDENDRRVHVVALTDHDRDVSEHFDSAVVQYVGSSLGCGCGFRNITQADDWLFTDEDDDNEHEANHQQLADLMATPLAAGERVVLFGCWDGEWTNPVAARHEVTLADLIDPGFAFVHSAMYTLTK
ncbi:MAG: hypothetical protein AAF266_03725 [Planctomycetota bacterium]